MALDVVSGAVSAAAASVLSQRHRIMQPRLQAVLPVVAALVAVSAARVVLGQRVFARLAPRFADRL